MSRKTFVKHHLVATLKVIQWRRFLLPVLSLLSISVMLWFYGQNISQQQRVLKMLQVQEARMELIQTTCAVEKSHQSISSDLKNFIVDDNHGLLYCYVPKVACTHLKGVMLSLKHGEPYLDPMSESLVDVQNPSKLKTLDMFPKAEIKAKLKHYTKFLFVRNPFARLISAFQNKFEQPNEFFYAKYGRHILQRYGNQSNPPHTAEEAFASGNPMSFYNFIKFLLDPETRQQPFNPHWRQINRLCYPCEIQYNFIGLQETLDDDAELLLRMLKLEKDIKFPPAYKNMTSSDSVLEWYKQVPLKERRKLFRIYKEDFKLFGYRRPHQLLDG